MQQDIWVYEKAPMPEAQFSDVAERGYIEFKEVVRRTSVKPNCLRRRLPVTCWVWCTTLCDGMIALRDVWVHKEPPIPKARFSARSKHGYIEFREIIKKPKP